MLIIWTMFTLEEAKIEPDDNDAVGPQVNITETPWIIAIVGLESFIPPFNGSHQDFDYAFCSGGLIHEQYVLTAAHCYENPNGVYLVAGLDVFEVVDKNKLSNETQIMTVDSWYNHPCYDKFTKPQFDVAVVRGIFSV
ncbi:hypothetical protein GE061_004497 [Apolygus lucorum]|uniref:Peptidase S1 domain-containing protein n=1 Tax=Apolygus lucorum TaxID=248454 RepID=A0A8S9X0W3_APOLU|nr:hypothetical protein GE061_004497 [Apolygus lucorum]